MSIPIVRRALLGALVTAGLADVFDRRPRLGGQPRCRRLVHGEGLAARRRDLYRSESEPSTVGLLGISHSNAIALGADQWKSLIELVHKAAAATAPAAWTEVGSIKDVSKDVATLTVSSGPGLRFVISSAKGGTLTHILPKADIARLEKALQQVGDRLSK